jgi:sugar lactone lactonase YvrE
LIGALAKLTDELLGRGDAAVTVPPFDGALKPNQYLEEAAVFAELDELEDLASDGRDLFVAQGQMVLRYRDGLATEVARFQQRVTALCASAEGELAVALDGRCVRLVGGPQDGRTWDVAAGTRFNSVNAITATPSGSLLVTDGSQTQSNDHWCHDLMTRGRTGRLIELETSSGETRELARRTAYAFGACAAPQGETWLCESWRHRVICVRGARAGTAILDSLPAYPSRITPAKDGGFWLTAFISRTQLVEFVLRENAYRRRMMEEIDPRYWVAPKLTSGQTFLEPMQGAHIRTMGVLKPWAPPISYGLVIRLSPEGEPIYSLHSRTGGHNHGVVAAIESDGDLYVLAKGSGRILRLPLGKIEAELRA